MSLTFLQDPDGVEKLLSRIIDFVIALLLFGLGSLVVYASYS